MASTTITYDILTGSQQTEGSIRYWAQYDAIPPAQVLELAQQWIYSRLRVREMIHNATILITDDTSTANLPTGFQDPLGLKLHGDTEELDYVQENLLGRTIDEITGLIDTGRPQRWTIFDELMQFDCRNDAGADLTGELVYYQTPDFLATDTNDTGTNFLTDRYGQLLIQTCVAVAFRLRKRPEANAEFALAATLVQEANNLADMGRRGQIMR